MVAATAAQAIEIHGHRGARGVLPENTLPAFEHAIEVGVDWLELDVGASKDGTIWVFHDRALNDDIVRRDGSWIDREVPLATLTDAELSALDVGRIRPGSSYADRYSGQMPIDGTGLPRLADLFDRVKALGNETVRFNIEIKSHPGYPEDTPEPGAFAEAVLSVIREAGVADRVLIQSFDWRLVREVMERAPGMPTACLTAQQSWMDTVGGVPDGFHRLAGRIWLLRLGAGRRTGNRVPGLVAVLPGPDGGQARRGAGTGAQGGGLDSECCRRHQGDGRSRRRRHHFRLSGARAAGDRPPLRAVSIPN